MAAMVFFEGLSLSGVGDVVVIEGQGGVVAGLDGFCDVAHQGVECLSALHQAHGEYELRVVFVLHLERDVVPGEHVPGAEAELEGVSEVDGYGDAGSKALLDGGLDRGLCGEHPGGAGEVNGHGVDVDACDGLPELTQDVVGAHAGVLCGGYEVGYSLGDEGAGAACGVKDALVDGVCYDLSHDGPCQPVRGVVLAKLAALIGRDDGLV